MERCPTCKCVYDMKVGIQKQLCTACGQIHAGIELISCECGAVMFDIKEHAWRHIDLKKAKEIYLGLMPDAERNRLDTKHH